MSKLKKPNLSSIRSADSKLDELAYALMTAESSSLKDIEIEGYFNGAEYTVKSLGYLGGYQHRKMQWTMKEFFEEHLKLNLVRIVGISHDGEKPPTMHDIEHAPGQFFKGIEDAVSFYETADGNKLVIDIHIDHHSSSYYYCIYSTLETDNISIHWNKLADEKNFYRGQKISCDCRFLDLSDVSWEDVILPPKTLQIIQNNVTDILDDMDYYKKFKISMKRGLILKGDPGTGKTQTCKAIAKNAKCSVLYALPQDFSPQRGGVRSICNMAKDLAPCIMMIEDIDWIAQDRHEGNSGFVIQLMNQLDGLEAFGDIITIGTTNHANEIEGAVKNRPGRFDRIIEIGKPDEDCRLKMIKAFTKKFVIDQAVDIVEIAKHLDGLSGAHIKDLCTTTAMFAIKFRSFSEDGEKLVLRHEHFVEATNEVKNKDFSTYQQVQNKKGKLGFGASTESPASLDELFGDDEPEVL